MTEVRRKENGVRFGPGLPTVLVGERINPTGRRRFAEELRHGDLTTVRTEATRQVAAGADILDVNVGVKGLDEPATLAAAVELVMSCVDVPICIDSSDPAALAAALAAYEGKALVNSVTAEAASMEAILPVVAEHSAAVIALPCDERGIPADPRERVAHAAHVLEAAGRFGIPPEDVVVDVLCVPVAAEPEAATRALETLRLVHAELGVSTTAGASNISFGLPERRELNLAFLAMAIEAGISSPITDVTAPELLRLCRASDFLAARGARRLRDVADLGRSPSR
jgi:5-methyltetrahydrofolate--homocysteine methyltransferase